MLARYLALLLCAFLVPSCVPVRPWERGALADRLIRWAPNPQRASALEHVFSVREAVQGGHGDGGVGCGCN